MEMENTTILSTVVGLAGILAEIIFRDALTGSVLGVVLSVVLAVIILFCAYISLDGMSQNLAAIRKKEENRRREYDEKVFRLLNRRLSEIVKFQKATYATLVKGKAKAVETTAAEDEPDPWTQLAEEIRESTLTAAKLTAKYSQKRQEKSDHLLEQSTEDILQAIGRVSGWLEQVADEVKEIKDNPPVVNVEMPEMPAMPVASAEPSAFDDTASLLSAAEDGDAVSSEDSVAMESVALEDDEPEEEVDPLLEALAVEGEELLASVLAESGEEETEEDLLASIDEILAAEEAISGEELPAADAASDEELPVAEGAALSEEVPEEVSPAENAALSEEAPEEVSPVEDAASDEVLPVIEESVSDGTASDEAVLETEEDILASIEGILAAEEAASDESETVPEAVTVDAPALEAVTEPTPPEPEKKVELTALDMLSKKQQEEEEVKAEPVDPNKQLSPEEIASMFAAAAPAEEPEPEPTPEPIPAPEPEPTPEPTPEPAPAAEPADPNKMLSPDDIAALIASMNS